MKKRMSKVLAIILCFTMLFCSNSVVSYAADINFANVGTSIMKVLYDTLNVIVEKVVSFVCEVYPDPVDWIAESDYNAEEAGFMPGRENYQTKAAEGSYWELGYSSKSLLPDDVDNGKYNLGRDLTDKKAKGVYDDQRIRVAVIDDNSGEGAVVMGAIDSLGVTSTDTRAIRKGVMEYCEKNGIKVASINISATHAHSVLDTQGVSTGAIPKLLLNGFYNYFGIEKNIPGMKTAEYFKEYFVAQSIEAIKEAFVDMESGKLYYDEIDCSDYIYDKRELIAKEDIPDTAALMFRPDSGSEVTYITDITCHATSFSASNGLVGSDYIYYMDQAIKEKNGGNLVMIPGAVGQVSRDNINVDYSKLSEWEAIGAQSKFLGGKFAELVLAADFSEELAPVLNATHKEIFIEPENSILVLACEARLVNNKVLKRADGTYCMPSEMGYIEFGNAFAFALFPTELYPEVFWDDEITNGTTWDDAVWPYDSLFDAVEGVKIYPVSITNDALGYVVTDNNFAFMGHIIGEEIADEVLSVGKHMGSFLVEEYYTMLDEMK